MLSSSVSVGKCIMFSGCSTAVIVRSFLRSFCRSYGPFLPQYLMNGLSNLDETYREYLITPADDLIGFWRSTVEVNVAVGCRGGEGIHVDAAASLSIFYHYLSLSSSSSSSSYSFNQNWQNASHTIIHE